MTITISPKPFEVYTFEELNNKAKEKALMEYQNRELCSDYFNDINQDIITVFKVLGFENPQLEYELEYKESFKVEGYNRFNINDLDLLEDLHIEDALRYLIKVYVSVQNIHDNALQFTFYDGVGVSKHDNDFGNGANTLLNIYADICEQCLAWLNNTVIYYRSKDFATQTFNEMEYQFLENGEVYNG